MLVVFSSKAHGDVMMFGDVATRLLKMMGMSGKIPGAVSGDDVAKALLSLQQAVNSDRDAAAENLDEDQKKKNVSPINISQRAFPLIEMLTAAVTEDCAVKWEQR